MRFRVRFGNKHASASEQRKAATSLPCRLCSLPLTMADVSEAQPPSPSPDDVFGGTLIIESGSTVEVAEAATDVAQAG